MKLALLLAFLLLARPLSAQVPVGSWPTELAAGAAADLLARGPWMAPRWRGQASHRVAFATGLSLAYEFVEAWNGQTNALRFDDVSQRFIGTVSCEAIVWLVGKIRR